MELSFEIIGTHLRLEIDTDISCEELFHIIRMRIETFEKKYSRFIPGNFLDTMNQERKGELDEDGRAMLEYALRVARDTNGYFDPTIGATLSSLGYGREEDKSHSVGYEQIQLDGYSVTLGSDVILEFGGVGKGYLIDVIKSIIDLHFLDNIPRYIIDFGGDIYARGGWSVGLENPHNLEEVIGTIILDDMFLACSSGSKRKWGQHHHLINPKTGLSAQEVVATFIEGKSGISTDSYATALAVMPFIEACETLFRHPDIEGIIMASDGRYFRSPESRSELFT